MSSPVYAENVLKACSSRLAFLYRNGSWLDFSCRLSLCVALVQPYIDYCCSSWYSSLSIALQNRFDVLQRKMIRFINSMDFRQHIDSHDLRRLSWLSVSDRVKYFKLLHLFRIRHDLAPRYLSHGFITVSDTHHHQTRSSSFNYLLSKDWSMAPSSFHCTSIRLWNSLPNELKQIEVLRVFKQKLKMYLLSKYD